MTFRQAALAILMFKSLELLAMHVASVSAGDEFWSTMMLGAAFWTAGWGMVWAVTGAIGHTLTADPAGEDE